jgi:hypothetical protein
VTVEAGLGYQDSDWSGSGHRGLSIAGDWESWHFSHRYGVA